MICYQLGYEAQYTINTLFGKTLVVTLTVLGSGMMPLAIAQAVDSPITRPLAKVSGDL